MPREPYPDPAYPRGDPAPKRFLTRLKTEREAFARAIGGVPRRRALACALPHGCSAG